MSPTRNLEDFASRLTERMKRWAVQPDLPNEEFNSLALQLFALQFESNLSYQKICQRQGILPLNVQHWNEIAPVPSAAFKELDLSCIPCGERSAVFFSSGTTEHRPSRHFHHQMSLEVYENSLLSWFGRHLWVETNRHAGTQEGSRCPEPIPLRILALTPPPVEAPNSSLVHMFDTLRRNANTPPFIFVGKTVEGGAWVLDYQAAIQFLSDAVEGNEPVMLLGTAFSFVHLLDFLADQGIAMKLPKGSRVLETGGYKGRSRVLSKSDLHAYLSKVLGVTNSQIVCEYGMSELSSQAYDSVAGHAEAMSSGARCFHFPPWASIQVISPETGREVTEGQTGLIRVFDLANVYSVMAIQTEDLGIRRGSGFELIGRAALAEQRGCSLMAG